MFNFFRLVLATTLALGASGCVEKRYYDRPDYNHHGWEHDQPGWHNGHWDRDDHDWDHHGWDRHDRDRDEAWEHRRDNDRRYYVYEDGSSNHVIIPEDQVEVDRHGVWRDRRTSKIVRPVDQNWNAPRIDPRREQRRDEFREERREEAHKDSIQHEHDERQVSAAQRRRDAERAAAAEERVREAKKKHDDLIAQHRAEAKEAHKKVEAAKEKASRDRDGNPD